MVLPTLPFTEMTWEKIKRLLERRILTGIDNGGTSVFSPPARPVPKEAKPIPIQDPFLREKPRVENFSLISYLISGEGAIVVGENCFYLRSDQGVVIPMKTPFIPHVSVSDRIATSEWLWIAIHDFGVVVHVCRLDQEAHYKSVKFIVNNSCASQLFFTWFYRNECKNNPLVGKALLSAFFALLIESSPIPITIALQNSDLPNGKGKELPLPLKRALEMLHRSYDKSVKLSELAHWSYTSPWHLCRLFRQYFGLTPFGYLSLLRLNIALHLIKTTNLKLVDIASLVGYRSFPHFWRQFVRTFGKTPNAFRTEKDQKVAILFEQNR